MTAEMIDQQSFDQWLSSSNINKHDLTRIQNYHLTAVFLEGTDKTSLFILNEYLHATYKPMDDKGPPCGFDYRSK